MTILRKVLVIVALPAKGAVFVSKIPVRAVRSTRRQFKKWRSKRKIPSSVRNNRYRFLKIGIGVVLIRGIDFLVYRSFKAQNFKTLFRVQPRDTSMYMDLVYSKLNPKSELFDLEDLLPEGCFEKIKARDLEYRQARTSPEGWDRGKPTTCLTPSGGELPEVIIEYKKNHVEFQFGPLSTSPLRSAPKAQDVKIWGHSTKDDWTFKALVRTILDDSPPTFLDLLKIRKRRI